MLRWLISCLAVTTGSHCTNFFCEGYVRNVASNLPSLIGPWEGWGTNPPIPRGSGTLSQSNNQAKRRRPSHWVLAGSCTTLPLFISTLIPPNLKYDEASHGIHVHSRPYQQHLTFDSAGGDSNSEGGEDYNISPQAMSQYPSLVTPMRVPLKGEVSSAPQSLPSVMGVNPPKLSSDVQSSEALISPHK
eukprot:GHVN01081895.1.p1 GENE.GHVN01081895.1~~GHVN01081895.1.p1  ORF type:complete len:188 (+),score=27.10 GHVN01081895.1:36-599(+)